MEIRILMTREKESEFDRIASNILEPPRLLRQNKILLCQGVSNENGYFYRLFTSSSTIADYNMYGFIIRLGLFLSSLVQSSKTVRISDMDN